MSTDKSETIEIDAADLDTIVEEKVEEQLQEERQTVSRRSVLGSLAGMAGAGALGMKYGAARGAANPADATGTVYFEHIGDTDYPVQSLTVENLVNYSQSETFDDVTVNGPLSADQIGNAERYPDPADDLQGIIDAMNALPSNGGTIHLQEGTYLVTGTYDEGPQWQIDKPVRVIGQGSASVIEWVPSTRTNDQGVKMIEVGVEGTAPQAAAGTVFRDFKIDSKQQDVGTISTSKDGHNIGVFSNDFKMEGVISVNSTGDGVEPFQTANDPQIIGCGFRQNFEQNVHLNGCTGAKVIGNTMQGGESNGQISTFAADGQTTEDCVIANNTLRGGNTNGIHINPGAGAVSEIDVLGNRIVGVSGRAINSVSGGSPDAVPSEIQIKNNTILDVAQGRDNRAAAIHATAGADITITDNNIYRSHQSAIYLYANTTVNSVATEDVTIADNTIVNPVYNTTTADGYESDGVVLREDGATITDVDVLNNKIIAPSADSTMESAVFSNVDGSGVRIEGNRTRGGSAIDFNYFGNPDYHRDNIPIYPIDVRTLKSEEGNRGYHDGSGTDNTQGPARYINGSWTSLVDGTTIS